MIRVTLRFSGSHRSPITFSADLLTEEIARKWMSEVLAEVADIYYHPDSTLTCEITVVPFALSRAK